VKKILVVDDEESIRLLYHDELSQAGYHVDLAGSGEEALAKVNMDPPDLITLDIKMKGMDGIAFLRKLRQFQRNLPVVICSAYGEFKQDFAVWASDAYITKTSDVSELLDAIRSILEKDRSE
jgi:DNA-binding response OmpR family regulator